jgi:hypothetical protein
VWCEGFRKSDESKGRKETRNDNLQRFTPRCGWGDDDAQKRT